MKRALVGTTGREADSRNVPIQGGGTGKGSPSRRVVMGALVVAVAILLVVGLGAMTTAISVAVARVLLLVAVILGGFSVVVLMRSR